MDILTIERSFPLDRRKYDHLSICAKFIRSNDLESMS